jgi:hypothetical protein
MSKHKCRTFDGDVETAIDGFVEIIRVYKRARRRVCWERIGSSVRSIST